MNFSDILRPFAKTFTFTSTISEALLKLLVSSSPKVAKLDGGFVSPNSWNF